MSETVNHPKHYNQGKIEVIEFIEDKELGFHLGNAVKYICRAGRKDPTKYVEDLEKAIWYLRRRIELKAETPRRPNDMSCRHLGVHSNGVCADCGSQVREECSHSHVLSTGVNQPKQQCTDCGKVFH